ncbi:MAG: WD40/YVTN/BNR-like repeat-containing protein, partial [Bacteroidota bacterium]
MKRTLLSLLCFVLSISGAMAQGGTWVSQATGFPNTSTGVFNISVVDQNVVWISSYDGSGSNLNFRDYSVTIDGGATWIPGVVPAPAGHAWSQIFGLNDQVAWAVMYNATAGSGGGIWKTTDGGVTWNQQGAGQIFNTAGVSFPNVVHFWDANNGFCMG